MKTTEETTAGYGLSDLDKEVDTMQTSNKFHAAQFLRLCYEGSILFFFVLGLVLTVVLAAYGLEVLSS